MAGSGDEHSDEPPPGRRCGGVAFLIRQRHRADGRMPRYGEVAAVYGGVARAVAPVLNSIAAECAAATEPDLSALVLRDRTGLPGTFNGQAIDTPTPAIRAALGQSVS